jgi:hypothetical protein
MATAVLTNNDFQTSTDDKNLEIFSLMAWWECEC